MCSKKPRICIPVRWYPIQIILQLSSEAAAPCREVVQAGFSPYLAHICSGSPRLLDETHSFAAIRGPSDRQRPLFGRPRNKGALLGTLLLTTLPEIAATVG